MGLSSSAGSPMKVLLIDHYDSFTYNLYQLIGALLGEAPVVALSDRITLEEVRALGPDRVVLSPGPGHPGVPADFGVSAQLIVELEPSVPMLGICLGHQGIIQHLGGRVIRAPQVMHGKTERIRLDPRARLFRGLPERIEVMRYHSLIGERASLPAGLNVTAETEGEAPGLVMAVEHAERPLFGLQFHPESIGTPLGGRILENFLVG
jgi:anthranilate synthase component 2